ncbi:hypothetical protein [Sorangium atrum]|uniref:Uncharacterized protein n=1 Tax=Sorangium atrum TaxID=2995308 RepID=A0ABT5C1T0_9BACT|nr:hypothetical protein [Sorangium aterium]MDC0680371.1 hypothetical protein [Sorangium aterium]
MKAPDCSEAAPTAAELRARLFALPGEVRALRLALARGELAPELADAQGRLLDAEGQAIAAALRCCSPPGRLADELLRALEA